MEIFMLFIETSLNETFLLAFRSRHPNQKVFVHFTFSFCVVFCVFFLLALSNINEMNELFETRSCQLKVH